MPLFRSAGAVTVQTNEANQLLAQFSEEGKEDS